MVANIPDDIVKQFVEQMNNTPVETPIPDKTRDATEDNFMKAIEAVRKENDAKLNAMAGEITQAVLAGIGPFLHANQTGFSPVTPTAPQQPTTSTPANQSVMAETTQPVIITTGTAVLPPVPAGKKSYAEFMRIAIPQLVLHNKIDDKTKKPYQGVHVVYGGAFSINAQLKAYYGEHMDSAACRAVTEQMAREGVIEVVPCKGGATVYLPGSRKKGSDVKINI